MVITGSLFPPLSAPWISYNLRTLKLMGTLVFGTDPGFFVRSGVQKVFGSPQQFDRFLDRPWPADGEKLPIAHVAGATLSQGFAKRILEHFQIIHNFYGSTEVGGIARNVLDNRVLATDVEAAADAVRNGGGLSVALGKSKRFPRLALQMIQVGEESGVLDAMLIKVADTFEADTQTTMDRLLAALVPAITLVLAVVVGVVILSVLAPIYDLTNVVG